jgi:hypothetical protein
MVLVDEAVAVDLGVRSLGTSGSGVVYAVKLLESLNVADALAQRFAAIDGRAVGDLIEESLKNAAEVAEAAHAPAPQRVPAQAKKAGKTSARRR